MQFLVKAYDGPDMLAKRMEVRPCHLVDMKALGKQIICAGFCYRMKLEAELSSSSFQARQTNNKE